MIVRPRRSRHASSHLHARQMIRPRKRCVDDTSDSRTKLRPKRIPKHLERHRIRVGAGESASRCARLERIARVILCDECAAEIACDRESQRRFARAGVPLEHDDGDTHACAWGLRDHKHQTWNRPLLCRLMISGVCALRSREPARPCESVAFPGLALEEDRRKTSDGFHQARARCSAGLPESASRKVPQPESARPDVSQKISRDRSLDHCDNP